MQQKSTVIDRASREWWSRPNDERFLTLHDLYDHTRIRSRESRPYVVPNKALVVRGSETAGGPLYVEHDEAGILEPTHWSLGQLARISHTPAAWLREVANVPAGPAFAAHAVNLGLRHLASFEEVQLLAGLSIGETPSTLRCVVGPEYGRIYDDQVVKAVMDVNEDGRWHVPAAIYQATNPKRATTL